MKTLIAMLFLIPVSVFGEKSSWADLLPPHIEILSGLEELSKEGKYGEIYDLLGSDYRSLTTRSTFIRISEEVEWVLVDSAFGTFSERKNSRIADAPVRGTTKVGKIRHHVDAVAFFIKEEGVWRMWNFPFAKNHLLDRPGPVSQLYKKEANRVGGGN